MLSNEEYIEVVDVQYYIEVDGADYAIYDEQNVIELVMITQQGLPGVSEFIWVESQW